MEAKTEDCSRRHRSPNPLLDSVQLGAAPPQLSQKPGVLSLGEGNTGISGPWPSGPVEHKRTVEKTELVKISILNVETSLALFSHLVPRMLMARQFSPAIN